MSFSASRQVIAIALSLLIISSTAAQQQTKPPYVDTSFPLDKRVDDLVSRMTLEEKVSQMMNAAPAISRLGIPEYDWWNEALHGVAFGLATVFPQAIGLGATFDPQLINRLSTVISDEARAKYHEALKKSAYRAALQSLAVASRSETFTLLHHSDDPEHNSAAALHQYLSELEAWCQPE